MSERVQLFGEGSYARDRFAGLDDRVTATAGVAYALPLTRPHSLTLEGGFGWTGEQRSDQTTLRFATATGALDYRWAVTPGAEFHEEAAVNADLYFAKLSWALGEPKGWPWLKVYTGRRPDPTPEPTPDLTPEPTARPPD